MDIKSTLNLYEDIKEIVHIFEDSNDSNPAYEQYKFNVFEGLDKEIPPQENTIFDMAD